VAPAGGGDGGGERCGTACETAASGDMKVHCG